MANSPPNLPSPPYLGEGLGILNFKQANDEYLKESWDRLLEIKMSVKPMSHIKLLLRSFYVCLLLFIDVSWILYLKMISLGIMLLTPMKR